MGTYPQQASTLVNFVVVEVLPAYNIILERPTLYRTKAVILTYCLVVKFPTPQGIGMLQGDQATTRYYYINSLQKNVVSESLNIEELDFEERQQKGKPGKRADTSSAS